MQQSQIDTIQKARDNRTRIGGLFSAFIDSLPDSYGGLVEFNLSPMQIAWTRRLGKLIKELKL